MPVGKDGRWYGTDLEADYAGTQYDQDNRQAWADITSSSASMYNASAETAKRRAEEDRREREKQADEAMQKRCRKLIRQVFDLYKSGNAEQAIQLCTQYVNQNGSGNYGYEFSGLIPIILYNQGKYKEALDCNDNLFIRSMCYEKLGNRQEAAKTLLEGLRDSTVPYILFAEEHYVLSKSNDVYNFYNNPTFNFHYAEFVPLVTELAEGGNKDFFKFMGDIYRYALGSKNSDYGKAREWYDKAVENKDPYALLTVGFCLKNEECGYKGNKRQAIKYLLKAASLGDWRIKDAVKEELKRNGFLGFLFGLVGVVGLLSTTSLILAKVDFSSLISDFQFVMLPKIFIYLITLIAGIVITYKAWVWRKNILFIILLALSAIGWLNIFDIKLSIDHLVKGRITFQSTAQINNEILSGLSYTENGVQKTVVIKNEWKNKGGTPLNKEMKSKNGEIKLLKIGDILTVTGNITGKYLPVEHKGAKGFVNIDYIGLPEK